MLEQALVRARYAVGNCVRRASRPWRERSIAPAQASTIFGCSFGADGWHHIRRTLVEIDTTAAIRPEDTTLWRFLTQFKPTSISPLAGVHDEEPLPLFVYPWGTFSAGAASTGKDPSASRFCGPSTPAFVAEEFERTVRLYRDMRSTGYAPYRFPHSFIGGTWLEAQGGARRFVVMQGNHRMAVLAHLGCDTIAVRQVREAVPMVRESEIDAWPLVVSGRCSRDHARKVFRLFFEQTGWHVARCIA
jgi:hypothetical protein